MKAIKQTKTRRVLTILAGGHSLHRFQAEQVGDHCLHSTVSALQRQYPLVITRKRVNVPNNWGGETSVSQYWLQGESLHKARAICGLAPRPNW